MNTNTSPVSVTNVTPEGVEKSSSKTFCIATAQTPFGGFTPPCIATAQTPFGGGNPSLYSLNCLPIPYPASDIKVCIRNSILYDLVALKAILKTQKQIEWNRLLPSCLKGKDTWDPSHVHAYELLPSVTEYDNQANNPLAEVYLLAEEYSLNTEDVFAYSVDAWLNESDKYQLSLRRNNFSINGLTLVNVYGKYGAILEKWALKSMDANTTYFLPVSVLVNSCDVHISGFFPRGKYHLQGFYDVFGCEPNPDVEKILTPSNQIWWNNQGIVGRQYITWMGERSTVDKVDWSPLYGKSLTYLIDSNYFTTVNECLSCMEAVCKKLDSNGCRVKLTVANYYFGKELFTCDYEERYKVYKFFNKPVPADLIDYDELLAPQSEYVAPQPIVSRMLNHRDIAMVYGASGIGKSFFLDSLAYALAHGKNFCDRFQIPETQSVLILNGEMTKDELDRRREIFGKMYGKEEKDAFVQNVSSSSIPHKLDTPEGIEFLSKLIEQVNRENSAKKSNCDDKRKKPISVVILDSLKTLTTSGDSRSGWNTLFENINNLRQKHDIAFIVVHHTNKENKSYGTVDTTVKVESEFYLTHDIDCAIPPEYLEMDKGYKETLGNKVSEWWEGHQDDIWFYWVSGKVREGKKSDRRPVLMHMCPEDGNPQWQCIDYLDPSHEWSPKPKAKDEKNENSFVSNPSEASETTIIPLSVKATSLADMNGYSRDQVLEALHESYIAGNTTREMVGQSFGTNKNGIDYVARKYKFTNDDFMYPDDVTI